jgi:uncharacterized membrane protein
MSNPSLSPVLARNIKALHERQRAEHRAADPHQRLARWLGRMIGSIGFAYVHVVVLVLWVVIQWGWTPIPPFDPQFIGLVGIASVESIFLTLFVLINQRGESSAADRRADLDLQISLLSEHEVTRLISLVAAIADRLGVEEGKDPEIADLEQDVMPEKVLDELDARDNPARG